MDIGSIFLILGLLVLVGLFVGRPFLERKAVAVSPEEREYSSLLAERDRILNALQELDFDFTLGKIPEDEYPAQRAAMLHYGADVLRKLDTYQAENGDQEVEERLEAAITARRADAARLRPLPGGASFNGIPHAPDDDLEVLIASRRRERKEKTGGFCPKCGRVVQKSDRFCPKCGALVAREPLSQ